MKYLTPEETAEMLAVKPKSVREWLKSGKLKGEKAGQLWRIREEDLESFQETPEKKRGGKKDDPLTSVIGYFTSEPFSQEEIERELYGVH